MIPAMPVRLAGSAFFLDVRQFTARGELAIPTDDAPAGECSKPQEPHQTHGPILRIRQAAISMPAEVKVCASLHLGCAAQIL